MGKSGEAFGAGLRYRRGTTGGKGAEAGEAVPPALVAGGAQVGQMRMPVVGMCFIVAGGCGAKKVEVDAVHGLRPICSIRFQLAMKRGRFRIRKILGT
jgi:hypothetical protein